MACRWLLGCIVFIDMNDSLNILTIVVPVKNEEKNMFRVVASTFADKASAVSSRDQIRASYPDAWLLYNAR